MSEVAQTFAWIIAELKDDTALMAAATGGVHQGFAPIGTTKPYALVVKQDSTDLLTMSKVRVFTHLLMQIKGVGPSSNYDALVIIADRIDELFKHNGASNPPTGGQVLGSYREQEIAYDELENGSQFEHLGGLYHIELKGT